MGDEEVDEDEDEVAVVEPLVASEEANEPELASVEEVEEPIIMVDPVHVEEVEVEDNNRFTCGDGWDKHGSMCYMSSPAVTVYSKAKDSCAKKGGQLAIVRDQDALDFLVHIYNMGVDQKQGWIGGELLTDSEIGSINWVDGVMTDPGAVEDVNFWVSTENDPEPDGLGSSVGVCIKLKNDG